MSSVLSDSFTATNSNPKAKRKQIARTSDVALLRKLRFRARVSSQQHPSLLQINFIV